MYYAFDTNGQCIACGDSEFTIGDSSIIQGDFGTDLSLITSDGNTVTVRKPEPLPLYEVQDNVPLSPIQHEIMSALTELSELVIQQQAVIEKLQGGT